MHLFRIMMLGSSAATAVCACPAVAQEVASNAKTTNDSKKPSQPEEIIVTATKRPEVARRISGSVTAFDERQLEALGANSLAD